MPLMPLGSHQEHSQLEKNTYKNIKVLLQRQRIFVGINKGEEERSWLGPLDLCLRVSPTIRTIDRSHNNCAVPGMGPLIFYVNYLP